MYILIKDIFSELSTSHSKQELIIDKSMLNEFINRNVITFWNGRNDFNTDDGIIELFSILDRIISQYSQKWDRSTLVMVSNL